MPDQNEKEDEIEKVEEALYSKNTDGIFLKKRHSLQGTEDFKTSATWNIKEKETENGFKIPYTKIFLGAFIFFVLALGFTFSKFFLGNNVVSGNNIDILVSGPASIAGGEVLPLDITVKNNNDIGLQVVDLHITYPDGTKSAVDQTTDMKNFSQVLGDINARQSQEILAKAILYGEENSQETIQLTVDYRITGSNAVFTKEKDFNVLISSSPVNINVNNPTEVNSNQQIDFSVEVDSNSSSVVKNLILKVDYPFGFNFSSSDPSSVSSDNGVFNLGDLAPGDKRNIKISGTVVGQDGEQKVFKFTVGPPSRTVSTVVETPLAMYSSTISLQKSSVGLNMTINGQSGDEVAIGAGSKNTVNLNWTNNLAELIYNMAVKIKLNGQTLDQGSVDAGSGFYNSSDNSITFDKSNVSEFSSVNPGDEGNMQFNFSTLNPSSNPSISFGNSAITMNISITGNSAGGNNSNNSEVLYSKLYKKGDIIKLKISQMLLLI